MVVTPRCTHFEVADIREGTAPEGVTIGKVECNLHWLLAIGTWPLCEPHFSLSHVTLPAFYELTSYIFFHFEF